MTTRLGRSATLAALLLSTLLTVVVGAGTATARGGNPDFRAPKVGTCEQMTLKLLQLKSDHSTAVPCSDKHTARVVGVVQLPQKLDWSSDTTKINRVVVATCVPDVRDALGRTMKKQDRTAYDYGWFIPTKTQQSHGARWISCVQILWHGAGLGPLPTDKVPALPKGALSDKVARCMTTNKLYTTSCNQSHGWRSTGAFVVASDRYPGAKALNAKATTKCADRVTTKGYRWTYQSKLNWQLGGDHVVVCYSQTSS